MGLLPIDDDRAQGSVHGLDLTSSRRPRLPPGRPTDVLLSPIPGRMTPVRPNADCLCAGSDGAAGNASRPWTERAPGSSISATTPVKCTTGATRSRRRRRSYPDPSARFCPAQAAPYRPGRTCSTALVSTLSATHNDRARPSSGVGSSSPLLLARRAFARSLRRWPSARVTQS